MPPRTRNSLNRSCHGLTKSLQNLGAPQIPILQGEALAGAAPAGERKQEWLRDYLIEEEEGLNDHNVVVKCADIQRAISEGATSFLFTEYQYVGVFMVAFAVLIFLFLGSVKGFSTKSQPCTYSKDKTCKPALANAFFSRVSFLLGAITSVVYGFLGMKIATYANARTTLEARKGVGKAFITAFRSGAVMGFFACCKWASGTLRCNQPLQVVLWRRLGRFF